MSQLKKSRSVLKLRVYGFSLAFRMSSIDSPRATSRATSGRQTDSNWIRARTLAVSFPAPVGAFHKSKPLSASQLSTARRGRVRWELERSTRSNSPLKGQGLELSQSLFLHLSERFTSRSPFRLHNFPQLHPKRPSRRPRPSSLKSLYHMSGKMPVAVKNSALRTTSS